MKLKSFIAALLLTAAGLQTTYAQGFRVYKTDGTVAQFSFRTDSIVFYDGIGSDIDFGPFTPVNQMIAGKWYKYKKEIAFGEDSKTNYMDGYTLSYKFLPYQGTLMLYRSNGTLRNILKVYDMTADSLVLGAIGSSGFNILTRTPQPQPVTSIALSDEYVTLQQGETYQLTATVKPEDADNRNVTWKSSDPDVAEVYDDGLVNAKGEGTCTITCSAEDESGVYAECSVTVNSTDIPSNVALLNIQVDAPDYPNYNYTRIYVRSVTFEGFSTKGTSDLNAEWIKDNSDSNWFDISYSEITIYDGRRDGKEAMSPASNEKPTGLNPLIVQSKPYTTSVENGHYNSFYSDPDEPGVTNTLVNLFNSTVVDAPVFIIPTQEQLKITIVYDIETADYYLYYYLSDGVTRGSSIENRITRSVTLSDGSPIIFECGKKYVVKLHLGINSVMVETEVSEF